MPRPCPPTTCRTACAKATACRTSASPRLPQAGVSLVISVDTGIRAFAAARRSPRPSASTSSSPTTTCPTAPKAYPRLIAVINPAQPGCPYPDKHLCGAAVAFKLAHALAGLRTHATPPTPEAQTKTPPRTAHPAQLSQARRASPPLQILIPLTGENRTIAMPRPARALRYPVQPGLRALMQIAELPLSTAPPPLTEVGFRLAPRINAAGRMDVASDVVELFSPATLPRASALATKLDGLNQARRATEAAALETIDVQLLTLRTAAGQHASQCLVLDHPEWHRGVLGILASRVVDRTGRPRWSSPRVPKSRTGPAAPCPAFTCSTPLPPSIPPNPSSAGSAAMLTPSAFRCRPLPCPPCANACVSTRLPC